LEVLFLRYNCSVSLSGDATSEKTQATGGTPSSGNSEAKSERTYSRYVISYEDSVLVGERRQELMVAVDVMTVQLKRSVLKDEYEMMSDLC